MPKAIRWVIRLMCLGVLAWVWLLLPLMMPGTSRLLAVVYVVCLVCAVDFSLLALAATFLPWGGQRQASVLRSVRTPDAEAMRQAAERETYGKGPIHGR